MERCTAYYSHVNWHARRDAVKSRGALLSMEYFNREPSVQYPAAFSFNGGETSYCESSPSDIHYIFHDYVHRLKPSTDDYVATLTGVAWCYDGNWKIPATTFAMDEETGRAMPIGSATFAVMNETGHALSVVRHLPCLFYSHSRPLSLLTSVFVILITTALALIVLSPSARPRAE